MKIELFSYWSDHNLRIWTDDCHRCAGGILQCHVPVEKYALDPDKVFYVTVWAVIGGFGGAKLLYLITQLPAILKDPYPFERCAERFCGLWRNHRRNPCRMALL